MIKSGEWHQLEEHRIFGKDAGLVRKPPNMVRKPFNLLGEKVHKRKLAVKALEEEPVSRGAMERGILRYMHAVNLAAWNAEEGAV